MEKKEEVKSDNDKVMVWLCNNITSMNVGFHGTFYFKTITLHLKWAVITHIDWS